MAVLRIESIAAGGDGVGRHDGLAVFVPRTAPGELVDARIERRGRLGRGRVLRIVEPSPSRVTPRCRHYDRDRCGGCQLQHLALDAQLEAKRRIVADSFARLARRTVDVEPVVAAPMPWEYRSRLTLALRRQGAAWIMGLHAWDDVDRVFDLEECPITMPRVVAAWAAVRRASAHLPPAAALRGTMRLAGNDLALVLEGGMRWPSAREFANAVPLQVIRWRPDHGASRVIVDRRAGVTPDEAFDQVNQPVAALARDEVLARVLAHAPATVIDAYAGLGLTARALAEWGVRVTAIERDASAVRYAAAHLPEGSRAIAGRVEDHLPEALPADVVVLNPPRTGVDARVTDALMQAPLPRAIVYMSCDPATLARDVARLPAYRVTSVRPYDMFPQTAHVEVVCVLSPEAP